MEKKQQPPKWDGLAWFGLAVIVAAAAAVLLLLWKPGWLGRSSRDDGEFTLDAAQSSAMLDLVNPLISVNLPAFSSPQEVDHDQVMLAILLDLTTEDYLDFGTDEAGNYLIPAQRVQQKYYEMFGAEPENGDVGGGEIATFDADSQCYIFAYLEEYGQLFGEISHAYRSDDAITVETNVYSVDDLDDEGNLDAAASARRKLRFTIVGSSGAYVIQSMEEIG